MAGKKERIRVELEWGSLSDNSNRILLCREDPEEQRVRIWAGMGKFGAKGNLKRSWALEKRVTQPQKAPAWIYKTYTWDRGGDGGAQWCVWQLSQARLAANRTGLPWHSARLVLTWRCCRHWGYCVEWGRWGPCSFGTFWWGEQNEYIDKYRKNNYGQRYKKGWP